MSEPTVADLMNAIIALGQRMEQRFAAIEAELGQFRAETDKRFAETGKRFNALEADIREFRADVREFRAETWARLDGIDKRLDEQGRFIAALIPTHIAAVPPPKSAA